MKEIGSNTSSQIESITQTLRSAGRLSDSLSEKSTERERHKSSKSSMAHHSVVAVGSYNMSANITVNSSRSVRTSQNSLMNLQMASFFEEHTGSLEADGIEVFRYGFPAYPFELHAATALLPTTTYISNPIRTVSLKCQEQIQMSSSQSLHASSELVSKPMPDAAQRDTSKTSVPIPSLTNMQLLPARIDVAPSSHLSTSLISIEQNHQEQNNPPTLTAQSSAHTLINPN